MDRILFLLVLLCCDGGGRIRELLEDDGLYKVVTAHGDGRLRVSMTNNQYEVRDAELANFQVRKHERK